MSPIFGTEGVEEDGRRSYSFTGCVFVVPADPLSTCRLFAVATGVAVDSLFRTGEPQPSLTAGADWGSPQPESQPVSLCAEVEAEVDLNRLVSISFPHPGVFGASLSLERLECPPAVERDDGALGQPLSLGGSLGRYEAAGGPIVPFLLL